MSILLTSQAFKEIVFDRSQGLCVCCKQKANVAHQLLDSQLWEDSGLYADNGVALCDQHHELAQATLLSVESLRTAGKITQVLVPPQLFVEQKYDKWGNPFMPNGQRLRGELFYEDETQRFLAKANVLSEFTHWIKYPRTNHMPWSPGISDDDRVINSMSQFEGHRVIVTEKMDGENTTMYRDHFHARSLDSPNHPSRSWAKNFWSTIAHEIPEAWRICAENVYAQHSITYDQLPSYLLGFSVWNDKNICLSWDDTQEWFHLLGIESVPIIYDGVYDEKLIKSLWSDQLNEGKEGYTLRKAEAFNFNQFKHNIVKYVRKGHVQTNKHWMNQEIKPNGLSAKKHRYEL